MRFPKVDNAIIASEQFQLTARAVNQSRFGSLELSVRVGISYGSVIRSDGFVTGEAVVRTQRVEQLAGEGEIYLDQAAVEHLGEDREFEQQGPRNLKGFENPVPVYSVRQLI